MVFNQISRDPVFLLTYLSLLKLICTEKLSLVIDQTDHFPLPFCDMPISRSQLFQDGKIMLPEGDCSEIVKHSEQFG